MVIWSSAIARTGAPDFVVMPARLTALSTPAATHAGTSDVVVTAAAGAFSLLFSWYFQPLFAVGYTIPFTPMVFDLRGVAFAAWTLAAFAIGALAGMLIRRVVPAIAATLAGYAGLAFAAGLFLRQHYTTPLVTNKPDLPGSAWAVSQWYAKDGKFAFPARGSQLVDAVMQLCHGGTGRGPGISGPGSPAQCLTQHGYTLWTNYQPGSRHAGRHHDHEAPQGLVRAEDSSSAKCPPSIQRDGKTAGEGQRQPRGL